MLETLESLLPLFLINSADRTKLYRDSPPPLPQLTDTAPQFPLKPYTLYSLSLAELREKL